MAINTDIYGSVGDAATYFSTRLHSDAWDDATSQQQFAALLTARRLIDNLTFKGDKHAVWVFHQQVLPPWRTAKAPSRPARRISNTGRGAGRQCQSALGVSPRLRHGGSRRHRHGRVRVGLQSVGRVDPQMELGEPVVTAQGYAEVRTHYERNMVPDRTPDQSCAQSPGLVAYQAFPAGRSSPASEPGVGGSFVVSRRHASRGLTEPFAVGQHGGQF